MKTLSENAVTSFEITIGRTLAKPVRRRQSGGSRRAQAALQVTPDSDLEEVSQRDAVAQKGCKIQAATVASLF